MQGRFHGIVLLPEPLAGFALDRAPSHVIFVSHQAQILKPLLRFHRRRRFEEIRPRKSAHWRSLDKADRQIPARHVPRLSVKRAIRLSGSGNQAGPELEHEGY